MQPSQFCICIFRSQRILPALAGLMLAPVSAEKPSDQPWQARWLVPAVATSVDLSQSVWIWCDEAGIDPTRNAPAGPRFFRKSITLPSGAVQSAVARFAADNQYRLSVNGVVVGGGSSWQVPNTVELGKVLKSGENELLLEVVNDADAGAINAAAVVGAVQIVMQGGETLHIPTDATWQGAKQPTMVGAKPVRVIGAIGAGPWQGVQAGSQSAPGNLWSAYRKSFQLGQVPASAPARIAVDSKYWLWINGKMVVREGGLKRGPNPNDTYVDIVDLAPYLVAGKNQIAVLAWFFGKDGFSHKSSGKPGFLFELKAGDTVVSSDVSWKVARHPAFGQAGNEPNFRLPESSVRFDARQDMVGWTSVDYDDRGWDTPMDGQSPPTAPWNRLWPREIPQWKDFGLKDYTNAAALPKRSDGKQIVAKLPYNAQVTPWLRVSAPAGVMIRMSTTNTANEIHAEYLTREGEQEFETPAWMSGDAVTYDIPAGVQVMGLKYRESGFDSEMTGKFSSDNPFVNQLWEKCKRTLYVNMRDSFFDCPDRERAQWWGDIVIQLGQVFYTFDPRAHLLIRKCMYNLCNWQRPSKTMFSPVPAGNWDKELPQQMLASIGQYGFWTYYLNTGDRATLEDTYPHVKDYLSIWQIDGDGLVVHRSGENGWDWADWGENVDIRMLDQAWFCLALQGAANMARELGKPAEAEGYETLRTSVIEATNRKFWNGTAYRDPGYGGATDDRAQGMAVVAGIAKPEQYPAIQAVLAKEFHASPYIEKYILEALFRMNAPASAMSRMQQRYQEMVASETSTLWELFTRAGTLNHAWTGGPLTLIAEHVVGITPTAPGWRSFKVEPNLAEVKQISCEFDSVRGRFAVRQALQAKSYHLEVQSPAGTTGEVVVPLQRHGFRAVRVNGQPLWLNGKANGEVSGVTPLGAQGDGVRFKVDPGLWKFEAR